MKTAISIPDEVFKEAEAAARKLGISRSELYSKAVREYVARYSAEDVTARLNEVYGERTHPLDDGLLKAQVASLPREDW